MRSNPYMIVSGSIFGLVALHAGGPVGLACALAAAARKRGQSESRYSSPQPQHARRVLELEYAPKLLDQGLT